METLEFDRLTGKTANDRNGKINKIKFKIIKVVSFAMLGWVLGDMFVGSKANRDDPDRIILDLLVALQASGIMIFGIGHYLLEKYPQNEEKAAQIDRFLKIFKNEILTKYKPTDIKNASMMGELVLGYMSDEEKRKVKDLYTETDFSDYASVKNFIEQIKQIVNPIFARNQGLNKQLEDIATGQTYMFNGWQYGNQGHGSR